MESQEQFDGLFGSVLQRGEGINNFLDNFFGFLYRKTDFYSNSRILYILIY